MTKLSEGFWSLGTSKEWTEQALDIAFAAFKRLKNTYGDQFGFVVQDLHREGAPSSSGAATSSVIIKIYIAPRNPLIEDELRELGLTFIVPPSSPEEDSVA